MNLRGQYHSLGGLASTPDLATTLPGLVVLCPGDVKRAGSHPACAHTQPDSGVLTQRLRRGAHGADESRSIAKLAGRDGDGSRKEGGKYPADALIQLGAYADASRTR